MGGGAGRRRARPRQASLPGCAGRGRSLAEPLRVGPRMPCVRAVSARPPAAPSATALACATRRAAPLGGRRGVAEGWRHRCLLQQRRPREGAPHGAAARPARARAEISTRSEAPIGRPTAERGRGREGRGAQRRTLGSHDGAHEGVAQEGALW